MQRMFFDLHGQNSALYRRDFCKTSSFAFFVAKSVEGEMSRSTKIFIRDHFAPMYFYSECKTLGVVWSLPPAGLISELEVHYN